MRNFAKTVDGITAIQEDLKERYGVKADVVISIHSDDNIGITEEVAEQIIADFDAMQGNWDNISGTTGGLNWKAREKDHNEFVIYYRRED